MKRVPWKPNDTLAAAKLASRAARRHVNQLAPRGLDAQFFDALDEEVAQFELLNPGQATQVERVRGKTRKIAEVLDEANRLVTGLRQAIVLTFPPRHPARAEFGTGLTLQKRSVPSTLAALQALVHGMETSPANAQSAGLAASDLAAVKRYLEEIPRADRTQEDAKDQRKAATAIRDALHLSIYGRMNRLRIAAGIALAQDPSALEEILNPFPGGPKRKKPTPEE